jgi:hypothetical protein
VGQAKEKKNKGEYFGQPGYVAPKDPHHLIASELLLPDVPEHARASVREFLAPFVSSNRVDNGDCWRIAQECMAKADSPRVGYVEGVWARYTHHIEHQTGACDCDMDMSVGVPHAWNTVDGYLVDLVVEFKMQGWTPEWGGTIDEWKHESLKEYQLDEFKRAFRVAVDWFGDEEVIGFSLTSSLVGIPDAEEFGLTYVDGDYDAMAEDVVFKPACERLQARYPELNAVAA